MISSQKKCSTACFRHCSAPPKFQLPASPCPELLLTNSAPSDVQINKIHSFIGSANAQFSILDDQIAQVQRALVRLQSQRAELADLVESHRGVVSTIRRLPRDILGEIFSQYLGASDSRLHSPKTLSHLVGVCARWRRIALTSPLLWRHICPIRRGKSCNDSGELQRISLQLQRSAPVALSIHLDETASSRVVDLLLTEASRWQILYLTWYPYYYKRLTTSKVEFPVLEKLTLVLAPPKDIALFVESLPAMVDFTLDACRERIPRTLDIIWAQLRTCTLTRCCTTDILHVLQLFSAGTRVYLNDFDGGLEQLTSVHTVVSGLSIRCYHQWVIDILLKSLTAPCLKEFCIIGCPLSIPPITAFFDRSSCVLTHLGIVWNAFFNHPADLLTLLRSPHASNIVDLDIDLLHNRFPEKLTGTKAPDIVPNLTGALTPDIVPNLRTLVLRRFGGFHELAASVLEMHAARRPIFQSLWLQLEFRGLLSQDTLQALKSGGLEVVIFD